MDEAELIDRASAAHARWCKAHGCIADMPSQGLSEVRKQIVILRNIRGEMGRYRVGRGGQLRRIADREHC